MGYQPCSATVDWLCEYLVEMFAKEAPHQEPLLLEREIACGCHEEHSQDRPHHMEWRDSLGSLLKRLDLCKLFGRRFTLDLRTDLTHLGVGIPKDGAKDKGDDTEHGTNPKPNACARSHPGRGKSI